MIETIALAVLLILNFGTSANLLWLIAHRRGAVASDHRFQGSARRAVLVSADGYRDQEILTQFRALAGFVVVVAALYAQIEASPVGWNWTVWTDAPWFSRALSYGLCVRFALDTVATLMRRHRWYQLENK